MTLAVKVALNPNTATTTQPLFCQKKTLIAWYGRKKKELAYSLCVYGGVMALTYNKKFDSSMESQ